MPIFTGVRLIAFERTGSPVAGPVPLFRRPRECARASRRAGYDRVFLPEWSALGAALPRSAPLLTNLATSTRLAKEISGLRLRDLPPGEPTPRRAADPSRDPADPPVGRTDLDLECDADRTRAMLRTFRPPSWSATASTSTTFERHPDPRPCRAGGRKPTTPSSSSSVGRNGARGSIEAVGGLRSSCTRGRRQARLVLAGAGGDRRFEPTRSSLLAMLPATAQGRVTWLGHVPGDELYRAVRERMS